LAPRRPHHGDVCANLSIERRGRIRATGPIVFDGLRTSVPHDVDPGERVRVGCFVRAPEQPLRMTLVMTLV
jgi:hypothetical protein